MSAPTIDAPALTPDEAIKVLADKLIPMHLAELRHLDWLDLWSSHRQELVRVPAKATSEHRALAELAKTPWLGLVVTTVAQSLFVDGYKSPDDGRSSTAWTIWQANRMEARQVPIHRAALNYGWCYELVLPGSPVPVLRGVSPRRMTCLYQRPEADDWPVYAAEFSGSTVTLYDAHHSYLFEAADLSRPVFIGAAWHGVGVCPVVRHTNVIDLEGRTVGEVEPYIDVAKRINKTAYDRLLVQHFNSWKVRYAIGLDLEASSDDTPQEAKVKLAQSDMLVAKDPTARFGTLDDTPMGSFIEAFTSDIEALAAASQTPTYALTGALVNLSADAIAAARSPLNQKVFERKVAFGESHAQALRLASFIAGDDEAATDFTSRITWQDMEVRSLSQAADALGKAVQMLGIPAEALWNRFPGATKSDVEEWKAISQGDAPSNAGPASTASDAADMKDRYDALGVAIRAGVEPEDAAARLGLVGTRFTGAMPSSLRLPEADAAKLETA